MSLVIHVGYLLNPDPDDAEFITDEQRRIEHINDHLRAQNHPPHHEPTSGADEQMFSIKSSVMPLYDICWYLNEHTPLDLSALLDMPIEDAFYLPFAVDEGAYMRLHTPYDSDDFGLIGYAPRLKQVCARVLDILDPQNAQWFGIERHEASEKWRKQILRRFAPDTIRLAEDGAIKFFSASAHAIKHGLIVRIC